MCLYRIRMLLFNLKDPKNPYLRKRLLSGELSPSALPTMSSADLANPELANMRKEFEERSMKKVALTEDSEEGMVWRERRDALHWHLHSEHSLADHTPVIGDLVNVGLKRSSLDGPTETISGPVVIDKMNRSSSEIKQESRDDMPEAVNATTDKAIVEHESIQLDLTVPVTPQKNIVIEPVTAPIAAVATPKPPVWNGTLDLSSVNELPDLHKRKFLVTALHANGPQLFPNTPKV